MSRADLENQRDAKNAEIASLNSQLPGLQEKVSRLEEAYNQLNGIAEEHMTMYPSHEAVLGKYLDDQNWYGETKNAFYFTIYDDYADSNQKMWDDIIDARDAAAAHKIRIEEEIRTIKKRIGQLESEVAVLNAEISAMIRAEEAAREAEEAAKRLKDLVTGGSGSGGRGH